MSGLAMQAHQSSRPASVAEHQFSHLWEMEGHGADAAVAAWPERDALEKRVRGLHTDARLVDETVEQALAKWVDHDGLRGRQAF